ncbi:MAG: EAL domain-containing protein [Hyphomicrobiales bacterium]
MRSYLIELMTFFTGNLPSSAGITKNSETAGRIRASQIAALTNVTPLMMLANIVNAGVVLLFIQNDPYAEYLPIWGIALCFFSALGIYKWQKVRDRKSYSASMRAQKKFLQSAALFGLIWAFIPMVYYPHSGPGTQVLVIAIAGGMMGGGAMSLCSIPKAMLIWLLSMGAGCAIGLAIAGKPSDYGLLALLVCFIIMLLHSGRSLALNYLNNLISAFSLEEKNDTISVLLKDFSENTSDWLWQSDEYGTLIHGQEGFETYLGTIPQCFCVTGKKETADFVKIKGANMIKKYWSNREAFMDVQVNAFVDGKVRWISIAGKPLYDVKDNFIGFRGVASDITDKKEAEERIAYLAHNDALTGLVNRTHFSRSITEHINSKDEKGLWAVMFLDLDGFKLVNDSKGHAAGDQLLEIVAKRIKSLCTDNDVVARLGGDEFAILCRSANSIQALTTFAEKLINAIKQPYQLVSDHSVSGISTSIGIALGDHGAASEESLLHNADLALYRAKHEGKATHRFFDLEMDQLERERRLLEQDLREALSKDQLSVSFQPLVSAETKKTEGFEALVRWNHPERGIISPTEFIPIAERMGLITEIGHKVLCEACYHAASWPAHLFVSVNLSPQQFINSRIVKCVTEALTTTGLEAHRLELEVTEGLLIENTENVTNVLKELKEIGVSIALDDFGTGYSSLSYLLKFPFDKLKIDRSFLMAIETDEMAKNVFAAIAKLGNILELKITAEGVETKEQVKVLESYDCTQFQGFLFGRPLTIEDMPAFLMQEHNCTNDVDTQTDDESKMLA